MQEKSSQASRVCVGERTFNEVAIGQARDALRQCLEAELTKLLDPYGFRVANVVITEVVVPQAQQAVLEELGASKFRTEQALQQEQEALANAQLAAAKTRGEVQNEQARAQEEARQAKLLAEAELAKYQAQIETIKAQKSNDLLVAQQELEIQKVNLEIARLKAESNLTEEAALAVILTNNPEYARLLQIEKLANAYGPADKIIIPAGSDPLMMLGQGILPTFDVQTRTPVSDTAAITD